ncbi:LysE family transporter [Nocardiopsis aegyptia]|uniref:LysE family transporter n=1 Tax=Nocardiopsis aegyptia TaxID=220378 RepID=UPI00366BBE53
MDRPQVGKRGTAESSTTPQPHTLALFLAATALVLIPGPNHLDILARAAAGGPRAGALSALGVETGTRVHAAAAAIGLSSLPAASSTACHLVRYLGAGCLDIRALARRATRGPRRRRLGRYAVAGIYLTLGAATALTGRR